MAETSLENSWISSLPIRAIYIYIYIYIYICTYIYIYKLRSCHLLLWDWVFCHSVMSLWVTSKQSLYGLSNSRRHAAIDNIYWMKKIIITSAKKLSMSVLYSNQILYFDLYLIFRLEHLSFVENTKAHSKTIDRKSTSSSNHLYKLLIFLPSCIFE